MENSRPSPRMMRCRRLTLGARNTTALSRTSCRRPPRRSPVSLAELRSEALRGRRDRLGGRRQLGRTGSRVPLAAGQAAASHHPRRQSLFFHVALPDRVHRRVGQCGAAHEHGSGGARRQRNDGPDRRGIPRPQNRRDPWLFTPASIPVHRRRAECRLARWLRCPRRQGIRVDRARNAAAGKGVAALPLETSRPGVFAIGDVRAGSTKRVAAAVGEGAAVVAQIHSVLAVE